MSDHLVEPHGGSLVDLMVDETRAEELKQLSREWPSWNLTPRQLCDLEMLLNGSFSPLTGFLGQADYDRVCSEMRLSDGTLWPMPINLDVSQEFADSISAGDTIALRDPEGVLIATMDVSDIWSPDKTAEAVAVFGSDDEAHPCVDMREDGVERIQRSGSTLYA